MQNDNHRSYPDKKNFYEKLLTIYGRKPVLEALQDNSLVIHRVHLAESNKPSSIIESIIALANTRGISTLYKSKAELSRISRNGKQDQGVAADLQLPNMVTLRDFSESVDDKVGQRYIALDGITNPQNLGMIIRSCAAGAIDALFIPRKNCAEIGPLAIKASAGAVFKCPIVRCESVVDCIQQLRNGVRIYTLKADGASVLSGNTGTENSLFILGNETDGVSDEVASMADAHLRIPLHNGVESLNVAVTAALIAYMT